MKISIIIPRDNWLLNLVPELTKLRHDVMVNDCEEDYDVIFATERSCSSLTKELHEKYPRIPLIVFNWDWYGYIDKTKYTWPMFIQLMKESKEVWANSKNTARRCEVDIGIRASCIFPAFILPWEWKGKKNDWGYIIQAGRIDSNKRFNWYEQVAEELRIPHKSYHPHVNNREDYVRTIKNCSFIVSASREESSGGLPCMEATYCKKPVLTSDNEGAKEVWGEDVTYFKKDSYEDFKKQMKWLWNNYKNKEIQEKVERAYQKINKAFLPQHMAVIISKRLNEVLYSNISK